jgi:hypothetical protein
MKFIQLRLKNVKENCFTFKPYQVTNNRECKKLLKTGISFRISRIYYLSAPNYRTTKTNI